jgi:integrase/recombinase XerD
VANLAAKIVLRLPASAGRGWLTPNGKTDPPGTYYIRFYEGSAMKQERVDGDFHEAELALLRKERLLKAHSQGFVLLKEKAPDGAAKAHRLTEIISAYIDQESKPDKNRDCRPAKSLRSVKSEFDLFYLAVKVTFVEELTRKHLEDWRDVLNLTYEPDTVYNKLMNATTVLKNNPLRPTPALLPVSEFPDKKETVPDPYTEDEFHTMLREATYDEGLLLYFFATSGMREQEVAHAEREDIDWSLGELHIVKKAKFGFTGKTRAALRQVPLTDELLGELHLKASGLLFPNEGTGRPEGHFLRIVERIATAAGVTPTTAKPHMIAAGMVKDDWCHRFRDTFLANEVHKAKNMADLMLLAKRVGHKDLKTLDKYFGKLKKPYESRLRIKRSTSVISVAS